MDGRYSIPWTQFLSQMRAYFVSNVAASVITAWSGLLFVSLPDSFLSHCRMVA